MPEHFIGHGHLFHDSAVRSDVPLKYGKAAFGVYRDIDGSNHGRILGFGLDGRQHLAHGFAGNRHFTLVDKVLFHQLCHDGRNTTGMIEIHHVMGTGRRYGSEMRNHLRQSTEVAQMDVDTRIVGDGGNVQD